MKYVKCPAFSRKSRYSIASVVLLWIIYIIAYCTGRDLVGNILSPFLCFVCTAFILHGVFAHGKRWFGWVVTSIGVLIWGIAETLWAVWWPLLHQDPEASVFLSCVYMLANLSFLVSVLYLALYDRRRWASFQFLLDISAISFLLTGFIYFVILNRFFDHLIFFRNPINVSRLVSLILNMFILSFAISIIFSMNRKKVPFFLNLSFLGIVLFIIADFMYTFDSFNESYIPNGLIDILYMLSFVILAAAGIAYAETSAVVFNKRAAVDSTKEMINRTLLLATIPVLAFFLQRLRFLEIAFFAIVILVHQSISLLVRQLVQKEIAFAAKSRQAEDLEARIDERTRELRVMNQTLENLVRRDAITGLYNRKYFHGQTENWVSSATADEKIWLMILDFDRFKLVNDTYGHDVGDQVLRLIGKRLESVANDRTLVSRLGGDEFGIVCLRSSFESADPFLHIITDLCACPIEVGNFTIHLGTSIGVSFWPDDAKTRSDLMRHADIAMYIAKKSRVGGVSFFDMSLNAGIERANNIDLSLRKADIDAEFNLRYQPQFTVDGSRLVGMEALVQWKSPDLGSVPPDEFIPVAEENGIIITLSEWIMKTALRQIGDWNRRYGTSLLMGINISPRQLDAADFTERLEAVIDELRIDPEWINLEMTERSAMKGESFMVAIFDRLACLNIMISIDDFGTGYSSLSYIKKFDIDYLKIAKELIDGIATNETDRQIVQAIIMMAKALGLRTIAEGVEDAEQVRILSCLGCDEIQGYYYGRAVSPDEFEERYLKG